MKTTQYFCFVKEREDRKQIKEEWILQTITDPLHIETQTDGRIRMWKRIKEAENRYLRVILLEDGETIHNAFFDRNFLKKGKR